MAVIRRPKQTVPSATHRQASAVLADAREAGLRMLPLDIEGVLKLYGVEVSYENMNDLSGYIERRGAVWFAGVNLYHSRRRQRFTLAHELGHFCLHADEIHGRLEERIFFRTQLSDDQEREANEFASDILIPKDLLFAQINKGKKKLSELADIFDVSLDAMRYKAYRLKLISEY